jgi:hypothetical protein
MGEPIEVVWDKDDFARFFAMVELRGRRWAIEKLRVDVDETLRDRIAEATAPHHLTDQTDADGNNACSCGEWWDSSEMGDWDQHMADVALSVVAAHLESLSGAEVAS